MKNVVILGAGLTGLSAGWQLAERGIDVDILEAKPYVGGLAASVRKDKYIFDYGPHRFHSKNKDLIDKINSMFDGDLRVLNRKSKIRLMGKYFHYPLEAKDLILNMNPFRSMQAFVDFNLTLFRNKIRPVPDNSFEQWAVNRFGRTLYNIYFGPYTEKLWGIPPNRISADWASQRISLINLWDVVRKLFLKTNDLPRTYISKFYYPEYGIGMVPEKMADIITSCGGEIQKNVKIKEIIRDRNKIARINFETKEKVNYLKEPDFLISTIPITDLVRLICPKIDEGKMRMANQLKYRALIFLFLMVERHSITEDHWVYYPEKQFIFTRMYEPKNFSKQMVPEGMTSLCVEISCNVSDGIWNMADHHIFEKVLTDLETFRILRRSEIREYFVERTTHAYPIYEMDYKSKLDILIKEIYSVKNLISVGRQGMFRYGNMDHAVEMGFNTADFLLSNKEDKAEILEILTQQDYIG